MINFLKEVALFSGLSDKNLKTICGGSRLEKFPKGKIIFSEGSKAKKAYVIKTGRLQIVKKVGNKDIVLAERKKGDIIGEIALIENTPRTATVIALSDSELIVIDKKSFDKLLKTSLHATKIIITTILKRWQKSENLLRQSEKMAQLGVLTAGITHELNNPASAVQRGSKSIVEVLNTNYKLHEEIHKLKLGPNKHKLLDKLKEKIIKLAKTPIDLDPIQKSDREDEVENWLESEGVENASELSVHIVNSNISNSDLEILTKNFDKFELSSVIHWLCSNYEIYSLLHEIYLGSVQISEIVMALKSYSYLDQGPIQPIDINQGIEDTLIILKNKLKKGIKVIKQLDKNLPLIEGRGSELNQVWTNLIDNAIDAMKKNGELTIKTSFTKDFVTVDIKDSGKGISKENQPKIFNPFFTTKEPGKGTGLGLDITYNIVVHKQKGDISFKSKKGETIFTVKLPRKIRN